MININDFLSRFYKERKRALVVRYSSLGDVVFDMHKVQEIKERIPAWDLTWLVREQYSPLVRRLSFIEDILVWRSGNDFSTFLRLINTVRSAKFDVFLGLQTNDRTTALAVLSGIPTKIGFHHSFQFVYDQDICYWLSALGVSNYGNTAPLRPQNNPGIEAKIHFQCVRPTVFTIIGASHPRKQWPEKSWRRFIEQTTKNGVVIALVGSGEREAAMAARLSEGMPADNVLNYVDRVDVSDLPVLAGECSVAVGGDTGPTHLAFATGIPTVLLLGPTSLNTLYLGLLAKVFFRNCEVSEECAGWSCNRPCMETISPDDVSRAVLEIIENQNRNLP